MAQIRTHHFNFVSAVVKTTVAYKKGHVNSWIDSRDVTRKINKFGRSLTLGVCSYWRRNDGRAHTLGISLGKSVLICNLEALKRLPSKLMNLLRTSKAHGQNTTVQLQKMRYLGVRFGGFSEVGKKFRNVVVCPGVKDREVAKSKKKGKKFSRKALGVVASEAFGCFIHGRKG